MLYVSISGSFNPSRGGSYVVESRGIRGGIILQEEACDRGILDVGWAACTVSALPVARFTPFPRRCVRCYYSQNTKEAEAEHHHHHHHQYGRLPVLGTQRTRIPLIPPQGWSFILKDANTSSHPCFYPQKEAAGTARIATVAPRQSLKMQDI